MSNKKRKILGVSLTENHFNLDIRISIHKNNISDEMISDLLNAQDLLVNGNGNQIYFAKIKESEDGKDSIEIGTDYYYGEG